MESRQTGCNLQDYLEKIQRQLDDRGGFAACFVFSIHKSGSSLLHSMIHGVCRAAKIPAADLPGLLFAEGVDLRVWRHDRRLLDLVVDGRIYYGFRDLPELLLKPDSILSRRKSVLLIRDPRDALVSQYFSMGGKYFSHALPTKNADRILHKAQKTEHLDVDSYVTRAAPVLLAKLKSYVSNLNLDSTLIRRYEDIYFDKHAFLREIFDYFEISVPKGILDRVATQCDVRPEKENAGKHIRKGLPGDHREKLQPRTISDLNGIFGETCRSFGYALGE